MAVSLGEVYPCAEVNSVASAILQKSDWTKESVNSLRPGATTSLVLRGYQIRHWYVTRRTLSGSVMREEGRGGERRERERGRRG